MASRAAAAPPTLEELSGDQHVRWTELWGLNLPPRIRMFLWRAYKNILPLGVELARRHVIPNPYCSHCGVELETIAHVLTQCRGLRQIWSNPPFSLQPADTHESFWSLYLRFKRSLPQEQVIIGLVIWWKTWDVRNKEVHGVDEGFPPDLVDWARNYLEIYQGAQVKPLPTSPSPVARVWVPPDPEFIKINVDAAFPVGGRSFIASMIARNAQGVTIWWTCKEF